MTRIRGESLPDNRYTSNEYLPQAVLRAPSDDGKICIISDAHSRRWLRLINNSST